MAQSSEGWDWGRVALRGVGIAIVIVGVPALMRNWSNEPAMDYIIAESDHRDGHYDKAIAEFSALIRSNPDYLSAYTGRGDSYRAKGDFERAFADLNEAIRRDSRAYEAYVSRCRAWQQTGEIDRAVADCEQAAGLKPDSPDPPALIGRMLLARGDVEAARRKFDAAVALQPADYGDFDNRFYRGQIALFHQDRPADAAEDFAGALKRAFDYRDRANLFNDQAVLMSEGHPLAPDAYYLVMWQHIARVRAGQDDAQELAGNVTNLADPMTRRLAFEKLGPALTSNEVLAVTLRPWPGRFIALYLGKVTPDSIRAAAEAANNPDTRRRRVCDVDFYLGVYALEKGTNEEARKLMQAAADGCPASAPEAAFAKSELKRMKS